MTQTMNYFDVFGLPRSLRIDPGALQQKFYELSRRYHPDFQQSAPPAEQERALELSALVNAAYRALRDPIARIEYLVRLEEGRDTREGSAVKPHAPPELLEEIFEVQEMLEDAKAGRLDDECRERLIVERERLAARLHREEERLTGVLAASWDSASAAERPGLVLAFKAALAKRAYLRTVIDDLEAALDPAGETDVTHHRH